MSLKVALLTYSTKPRGGVVHTLNLAEALARHGADVTVWSLRRSGDSGFFRPVDPAVSVQLVDFTDYPGDTVTDRIVRSIETLRAAFSPDEYDIVHAQDCISANAVGSCIRTIHHLDEFTTPVLAQCHERAIVEPYALICVSSAVATEVQAGWHLTPTVIPNGVQAERFAQAASAEPGAATARERWRAELGHYVLAVGGIEPRKGTLDLIEAYSALPQRFPHLSLVIAGGETLFDYRGYRAQVDQLCLDLGVRPRVLGAVSNDALPALIAACEVFAFPSTKEGFGLAALEALAAGRPVVTRDLPVLREVFSGTVQYATDATGLADALAAAIECPVDPEPGRALAQSMTWDSAAEAHLEFYHHHRDR